MLLSLEYKAVLALKRCTGSVSIYTCQGSCSLQVMAGPRCVLMDLPSGKDLISWSYKKDCLPEMCLAFPLVVFTGIAMLLTELNTPAQ